MTNRKELVITDNSNDTAKFIISDISGKGYVSVNGETQVRFEDEEMYAISKFFAQPQPEQEEVGLFFLLRQRKDNPLKIKVMFANSSSAKFFTTRKEADLHQERMTHQHGVKFNFFVVKEAK